jgi:hypothetical protein
VNDKSISEQAGLTGTVGADDGQDFSFFHLDIDVGKGLQATEGKGKVSDIN